MMSKKFAELRANMALEAQASAKNLAQDMHIRLIKQEIERGLESGPSEPLDMTDLKRRLRAKKGSP